MQGKKLKKAAAAEQLDVEADAEEEAELARMREAGFATGAEAAGAASSLVSAAGSSQPYSYLLLNSRFLVRACAADLLLRPRPTQPATAADAACDGMAVAAIAQ